MIKNHIGLRIGLLWTMILTTLIGAGFHAVSIAQVRARSGWAAARVSVVTSDLNTVYFDNNRRGWAAGDGGTVITTDDGGITWKQQETTLTDDINDIYFRNKDDGFLLAGNRIWQTANGGARWRETNSFAAQEFNGLPELYSLRFVNKKRGWIVGSISRGQAVTDSLVLTTADGGATWERQSVPTRTELIDLAFDDERRGWVVGADGVILYTEDGGVSWTLQRSNTKVTLYNVEFRNARTGWAVGERGTILRTSDGGVTWFAMRSPVTATLLSVRFVNNDDGYAVGRGGTVIRTGDGGRAWVEQESRTKNNLYALFARGDRAWAVGSKGVIAQYEK